MNTLYLDETFLRQISNRLDKFKQTSPHHFNARCPICGDSKRNKSKARWHAFQHSDKGFLVCKCFNCGYTNSFDNFLKEIEPEVHKMYLMEKFREANNNPKAIETEQFKTPKPVFDTNPLKGLKKISQLPVEHPVKKWVAKRRIPSKTHHKLYLCMKFKKWVNSFYPDKFEEKSLENDEPRLLIPLFDEDGVMFGVQGRAFKKDSVKYITIMLREDKGRWYGLDTLNRNATAYCVEGPIDSLFIENGIASCGGDIVSELELLNMPKEDIVVVYDNEPRSKDTIKKIEKAIENNYPVCIWPDSVVEKDINDMVLVGYTPRTIRNIINDNTFTGLAATLRLSQWKKV